MKVFLQNDDYCRVVTVKDSEVDLNYYDDIWDVYIQTEFAGVTVDVCITGDKTTAEIPGIDYAAQVLVEAYIKECDKNLFECHSPIISDEHTGEQHCITSIELIRQMAQIALPIMAESQYIRDFAFHDTGYVRRTEAKRPFLWLVRANGTYLFDLTTKEDVTGLTTMMDLYREQFCLYHFDTLYLRPILPQTAREMLEKIYNQNKQSHEENRM